MMVSLVGLLSVLLALAAVFSYHAGLQEAGEMFDARLAQSARVVMSLMDEPLADLEAHPGEAVVLKGWHGQAQGVGEALAFSNGHAYETKLAFQAWSHDGNLLLRSDSAPTHAFAALSPGYADVRLAGYDWRVFTLRSPSGRWFQSAERADIRAELAEDIAEGTLLPMALALPLMVLLIWVVVRWATRALVRVSDQIGERDPERMTPLELSNLPREVHGLVRAVNGLLHRLDSALARERRFIADAAHELRTPISALKVHAGNLRQAEDGQERRHSQAQLDASVSRVERLVAQLLSLSRSERSAGLSAPALLDLDALVMVEVEELAAMADCKRQQLSTDLGGVQALGNELGLGLLVRNLIENAVRYTPTGGRIVIRTQVRDGAALLSVEDSGPGIPEVARERVFHRFHRELGSGEEGSGLGLAIVREVVDAHAGGIVLSTSSALGGLAVEVSLPRA
ncbi:ATP-binding protein [Pseudoxanthomonas sp. JBR18]|uniref:ATP-binding protein n=1 Tax=Pseudoxanthomonas sp. JBR18 TaxID=2969308 RepID=UPI002305D826|nr:ATP-binding protein [Pseudoxanthomonas sp. JBR18]WCE06519.1 ATP-binding protein [Pseudoxanthomonas sp. JBR18]